MRPASQSSDAVCEDRSPPATLPWETQGPPAWPPTTQPTTAWARASQEPFTPPTEPPRGKGGAWPPPSRARKRGVGRGVGVPSALLEALWGWTPCSSGPHPSRPCLPAGPQLAAVLGLGLGLLAPVAAALALLLHHRAWRLPPSEYPV